MKCNACGKETKKNFDKSDRIEICALCSVTDQVRLTYNAVYHAFGEDAMIAYERLVDRYLDGQDRDIEILQLASAVENLNIASRLVETAKAHAKQIIDENAKNDFDAYVNMDSQEILK